MQGVGTLLWYYGDEFYTLHEKLNHSSQIFQIYFSISGH